MILPMLSFEKLQDEFYAVRAELSLEGKKEQQPSTPQYTALLGCQFISFGLEGYK